MCESSDPQAGGASIDAAKRLLEGIQHGRDQARQALRAICEELAPLGVETVRIGYDGYGDEGAIDQLTATAGDQEIELTASLQQRLRDVGCDLLPLGWQDNSGSCGELMVNVAARKLTRNHGWRVEEVTYEKEEEDLDL